MLGNLLDNARKWAKSRVRLVVTTTLAMLTLHIEDLARDEAATAETQHWQWRRPELKAGPSSFLEVARPSLYGMSQRCRLPVKRNERVTLIPLPSGPAVTRLGDIWQIGSHRLICGDSTERETYQQLLGEARAQLVFTDPPYNVPIAGHVGGLGSVQHREFEMASGEMSPSEFTAFLTSVFAHLAEFSVDGSIHFQCMDWRSIAAPCRREGIA